MKLSPLVLTALISLPCALAAPHKHSKWPDTPFTASGRDVISASGDKVVYAGVNWPGAADTMLPEGLQYNSIANIASFIKDLGMNVVRLTYAIEMIDNIYANNDTSLQATLNNALGSTNGSIILQQILKNNPQFTAQTTCLEVFDAVAAGLAEKKIWVHLDNHVSKAEWCCSETDGNAWWGDTYFNVYNWRRGLGFMANHTKSWTGLASMSLRNEPREPEDGAGEPYTWKSWMNNVAPGANAIHGNNSLPLIFFSGMNYDTDDSYFIDHERKGGRAFNPKSYKFADKIVYEVHNYQNSATACNQIQPGLYTNAYCAMNVTDTTCPNHGPVVMTEFGFDITDGSDEGVYAQCIKETVTHQPGGPGGWMQWVMSGSYYIRSGIQDYDETWGLLDHNWSGWRNSTVVQNYVKPFVKETL